MKHSSSASTAFLPATSTAPSHPRLRAGAPATHTSSSRGPYRQTPQASQAKRPRASSSRTSANIPRVESLVRSKQVGMGAVDDLRDFLRAAERKNERATHHRVSASGSASGTKSGAKGSQVVDCYVMPEGRQVVLHPGV